ncbi:TonB-dependent receptor plug domain-containing protein [Lichenicola sp.]|uniref:TonB-dependent receptor plug domain-containing protein n=1 Tax=Lichenicola sp. TaxID=2804529 RepID=UPI003B00ECC3
MLKRSHVRTLLASVSMLSMSVGYARAQSVDYSTMEQMFGEPITTSVTGKPQRASDAPGDLTIITQDDIRHSGADNIPDILQFIPGIDVRQYSFGDTQVGVRGYDTGLNPRLLVLVNGRQVYLDDQGYVAWNLIPVQLDEIRQIEVLKGPNSALFGFNAASGVINIITYDPVLDTVDKATARGGTQAYGAGDAVGTWHISKTAGVRVSIGGWTANNFSQPGEGVVGPSPRYASVNIDGRWQVTSNIELRASGGYTDAHTLRFISDGSLSEAQNQVNFYRIGGADVTRAGTFDLDFYRNQSLNNYGLISDNNDYIVRLTDLLKLDPSNTIRVGLEYRNNSISGQLYGGTVGYSNYAMNGMWDWQISPTLDMTNAARIDYLTLDYAGDLITLPGRTLDAYNDRTITAPSFNSGLVYKPNDVDTIRLTAGRGLQIPSLIAFGIQLNNPPLLLAGSPSLDPTAVWNAELAYDRTIALIGATVSTSVFFQRNTNLIAPAGNSPFSFSNGSIISESNNVGSSNEIGFEVGLKGKTKGGFRWNASYRYASITQDLTAGATADANAYTNYVDGTPKHEVVLGGGYTLGKIEMDMQGRWQSSYTDYSFGTPASLPLVVGDYVSLNARIGYKVTKYLTVAGTAEQFNLAQQIESAGEYVERRFFATATFGF